MNNVTTGTKLIVTHGGRYHLDELTAIAVLSFLHDDNITVYREKDSVDVMEVADYVIDIGYKSDGVKFFDHHQEQFRKTHANGTPMASAGLIWEAFGAQYVKKMINRFRASETLPTDLHRLTMLIKEFVNQPEFRHHMGRLISFNIIEPVDAFDNGLYDVESDCKLSLQKIVSVSSKAGPIFGSSFYDMLSIVKNHMMATAYVAYRKTLKYFLIRHNNVHSFAAYDIFVTRDMYIEEVALAEGAKQQRFKAVISVYWPSGKSTPVWRLILKDKNSFNSRVPRAAAYPKYFNKSNGIMADYDHLDAALTATGMDCVDRTSFRGINLPS